MNIGYLVTSNVSVLGFNLRSDCLSLCATYESAQASYREFCHSAEKRGYKWIPISRWKWASANEKVMAETPVMDVEFETVYISYFGLLRRRICIETWILRDTVDNKVKT